MPLFISWFFYFLGVQVCVCMYDFVAIFYKYIQVVFLYKTFFASATNFVTNPEQTQLTPLPPCPRSQSMFYERSWGTLAEPTSLDYAESTKFATLARRMSFIARYIILLAHAALTHLLSRSTLPDEFARSHVRIYTQN